ncbi:MAG: polysaccharide lyase family 7 protein, partial [Stackebrandtia sp.]
PTHADADAAECQNPGEVLDLKSWKLTLPVADPEDEDQPLEIFQPELDAYSHDPWFVAQDDCEAVRFSNPVNGVTTPNSDYSRSELREMTEDGQDEASWSSTEGTHTLVVQQAITSLPKEKDHVVAGQIHDEDDDVSVFRLEGSSLYVTDDDDSNAHLITDNYELGTKFEAKFVVTGGEIQAYYDGELVATLSKDFSGGYFKAGAYTQANCENSSPCSEDNFGEVVVYDVAVTHE